jgi:hypothetical protein
VGKPNGLALAVSVAAALSGCESAIAPAAGLPFAKAEVPVPPLAPRQLARAALSPIAPPPKEPPPPMAPPPKEPPPLVVPPGLVNCYGATLCDPNQTFCIKFFGGTAADPQKLVGGPACYEPLDCGGLAMDCTCITQDASLGHGCVTCVDNQNGTFSCFPQ